MEIAGRIKDKFIIVDNNHESSLIGFYIATLLNQGNEQAVIAADKGAVAAFDILI